MDGIRRRVAGLGRGGLLVVAAVIAGIAGIASEVFLFRRKPEQKDAYQMLDEDPKS